MQYYEGFPLPYQLILSDTFEICIVLPNDQLFDAIREYNLNAKLISEVEIYEGSSKELTHFAALGIVQK